MLDCSLLPGLPGGDNDRSSCLYTRVLCFALFAHIPCLTYISYHPWLGCSDPRSPGQYVGNHHLGHSFCHRYDNFLDADVLCGVLQPWLLSWNTYRILVGNYHHDYCWLWGFLPNNYLWLCGRSCLCHYRHVCNISTHPNHFRKLQQDKTWSVLAWWLSAYVADDHSPPGQEKGCICLPCVLHEDFPGNYSWNAFWRETLMLTSLNYNHSHLNKICSVCAMFKVYMCFKQIQLDFCVLLRL